MERNLYDEHGEDVTLYVQVKRHKRLNRRGNSSVSYQNGRANSLADRCVMSLSVGSCTTEAVRPSQI